MLFPLGSLGAHRWEVNLQIFPLLHLLSPAVTEGIPAVLFPQG